MLEPVVSLSNTFNDITRNEHILVNDLTLNATEHLLMILIIKFVKTNTLTLRTGALLYIKEKHQIILKKFLLVFRATIL